MYLPTQKPDRRDLPAMGPLFVVLSWSCHGLPWHFQRVFSDEHVSDCRFLLLHQPTRRRDRRLTAACSIDLLCNTVVLQLPVLLDQTLFNRLRNSSQRLCYLLIALMVLMECYTV